MPYQSNVDGNRIFISCSSADIEKAEKLEEDLKKQRVSPWIYINSIRSGKIWLKEIDDALGEADYVLGIRYRELHSISWRR